MGLPTRNNNIRAAGYIGHVPQRGIIARYHACASRALLIAIPLVALILISAPASAQTMSTEAFLASPAATAYLDQRYEDALQLLGDLEAQYPDDVTIRRIKGMALYNLKRYAKAAKTFQGVIALDPENAAAQFWYGTALYKIGAIARAYRTFQQAVSLAPDSPYGLQSAKFIESIDKQTKGAKRLSVDLTAGVQYDDNVSLTNTGTIHSTRFFEQINGRFLLIRKPGWLIAAEGSGYFSQNTSGDLDVFANKADDFDLVSGKGGIDIVHKTSAFGMPVTQSFNYTFELVSEGYDRFSDIHTLTTSLEVNPKPNKVIRIYHKYHKDFYERDGFDPRFSSRDGDRHVGGIEKYLYLKNNRHYIWAAYEYAWTDADGVNFDSRAHQISGGFSVSLSKKLILNGSARYAHTRYVNFLGPPRRRSAKQTYSGKLTRILGDKLSLSVGYSYSFDDSNYAALETVRNLATFTVKRRF